MEYASRCGVDDRSPDNVELDDDDDDDIEPDGCPVHNGEPARSQSRVLHTTTCFPSTSNSSTTMKRQLMAHPLSPESHYARPSFTTNKGTYFSPLHICSRHEIFVLPLLPSKSALRRRTI
jgi:hypothetical protein